MAQDNIQQIFDKLEDHEKRICTLEKDAPSKMRQSLLDTKKIITLPELIRGKKLGSGQEKVAVIVGYCEKITQKQSINGVDVKSGWKEGKFDGKYDPNFLARAIKDGLVRKIDGNLDLSQSGENFFDNFLNSNAGKG